MVVPSPFAVMEKVPVLLDVYVYVPDQAGEPPGGGVGTCAMKGPALWPRPLAVAWVRSVRLAGSAPMWALNMPTAEAMVRASAWALATRARVDRKSTRLNSSHPSISYAVFCLKKKTRLTEPK